MLFSLICFAVGTMHLFDSTTRPNGDLLDDKFDEIDQTMVIYVVMMLSLYIFRNDFPFNLIILVGCAFLAGLITPMRSRLTTLLK